MAKKATKVAKAAKVVKKTKKVVDADRDMMMKKRMKAKK